MGRGRSRSVRRGVAEERGRSRARVPAGGSAAAQGGSKEARRRSRSVQRRGQRSLSTAAERRATSRSLSRGRTPDGADIVCSEGRAGHILDKHLHPGADSTGSYFHSKADLDRAVGRALERPDARRKTGWSRRFYYKSFQRALGQSNGYGGRDEDCDSVAAIADDATGEVVSAWPIARGGVGQGGRFSGSLERLKDPADPPSLLSDSLSDPPPSSAPTQPASQPLSQSPALASSQPQSNSNVTFIHHHHHHFYKAQPGPTRKPGL